MLPTVPITLGQVFLKSLRQYGPVLKKIILIILIAVLIKNSYLYLGGMPTTNWLRYLIEIMITIVIGYFVFVGLYMTNKVINHQSFSFIDALKQSWPLVIQAYLASIIYIIMFVILYFLAHFILHLIRPTGLNAPLYRGLVYFFVTSLPFLLFIVFSFFTIPLIIIDEVGVLAAFITSFRLIGSKNWLNSFGLYVIFVLIFLIVDPYTRHGEFLARYHLNALFDFIILSIALPLFYSMIVFTLNDLKVRKRNLSV